MPSTEHFSSPRPPDYWAQACAELSARDPVMQGLIERFGVHVALTSRGDAYYTLMRSIVGQQISVKAADAVWGRLVAAAGEIAPSRIDALTDEAMRACGLSGSKVRYARGLSHHFLANPKAGEAWALLDEEASIAAMVALHGIGRWTAEMMLIFHQMRPDVWPLGDIGLINALKKHYGNGKPLSPTALARLAKKLTPWRTVATWYLWRSLDPAVVEY